MRQGVTELPGGNYHEITFVGHSRDLYVDIDPVISECRFTAETRGKVVYDTGRDITWLADANLAASKRFGLPLCDEVVGEYPACLQESGQMEHPYANAWLAAMNRDGGAGYLGFTGLRFS